jgi:hypothetical protein
MTPPVARPRRLRVGRVRPLCSSHLRRRRAPFVPCLDASWRRSCCLRRLTCSAVPCANESERSVHDAGVRGLVSQQRWHLQPLFGYFNRNARSGRDRDRRLKFSHPARAIMANPFTARRHWGVFAVVPPTATDRHLDAEASRPDGCHPEVSRPTGRSMRSRAKRAPTTRTGRFAATSRRAGPGASRRATGGRSVHR